MRAWDSSAATQPETRRRYGTRRATSTTPARECGCARSPVEPPDSQPDLTSSRIEQLGASTAERTQVDASPVSRRTSPRFRCESGAPPSSEHRRLSPKAASVLHPGYARHRSDPGAPPVELRAPYTEPPDLHRSELCLAGPEQPAWKATLAPFATPAPAAGCSRSRHRPCPTSGLCVLDVPHAVGLTGADGRSLTVLAAGFLVRVSLSFTTARTVRSSRQGARTRASAACSGCSCSRRSVGWRHDHAVHHATSGDLDRRGVGDIVTLTVAEYPLAHGRAASRTG